MENENQIKQNEKYQESSQTSSEKEACQHDWHLLDLGTGDYSCSYCKNCGDIGRNL